MTNYDSILKEEKKYEESVITVKEEGPAPFPKFKIAFILISIVLVISYIAYYYIILTPKNVFLTDIEFLKEKYLTLLEPLNNPLQSNNYNLKGNINQNDKNYNFIFNRSKTITKFNLSLNDSILNYYSKDNQNYLSLSNFNENYYKIDNDNYYDVIENLKNYFLNEIEDDKFIKKVYIDNARPIVESNLVLTSEDIIKALSLNKKIDNYKVLFTFKNNAVSNKIISLKIIINNETTGYRGVLLYQNGYLTYKDDINNLKYVLEKNNKDFTIKIYKDEEMYSVLSGTSTSNTYQYLYQVIDKVYNITLDINTETALITYKLSSSIEIDGEVKEKALDISFEANKEGMENTYIDATLEYSSLTEEEKNLYQTSLDNIIGELRKFIKEYQQ